MNGFKLHKHAILQFVSILFFLPTAAILATAQTTASSQTPIRVAIVGLVHGHVAGFLPELKNHPEIQLVGIEESDTALAEKYEQRFHLDSKLFLPKSTR